MQIVLVNKFKGRINVYDSKIMGSSEVNPKIRYLQLLQQNYHDEGVRGTNYMNTKTLHAAPFFYL